MTGQSNMQGHGCENNLKYHVANNPAEFGHLWDASSNSWATRDDVLINYFSRKSTQSLGACGFGVNDARFGPETGIGWTVGDALTDDVLLLKIAWGGRDLAINFRPPDHPVSCLEAWNRADCSVNFHQVVDYALDSLANIATVVPDYANLYDGYELSGFVFFQGFNDVINQKKVDQYNDNLYYFMRDMRTYLDAQNLPIVIGELGMHGDLTTQTASWKPRVQAVRDAQRNATAFTSNAVVADTAQYVNWRSGTCTTPVLPGDAACQCQGYHYYNDAFSYFNAGVSMGNALLSLM